MGMPNQSHCNWVEQLRVCQLESYRRPSGGQANVVCTGNGNKQCTRVEAAKRK